MATVEDMPAVMELITELAIFEKAADQITNTVEQLAEDGFGDHPLFETILAQDDDTIIGMSLYYFRYSTWRGKRLYLKDLIVTQSYRGRGTGRLLFEATIDKAKEQRCTGMVWQVLDWNQPAIKFYQTYTSDIDGQWMNVKINFSDSNS
jgi:GNAT superfamily N-acetyltransferase